MDEEVATEPRDVDKERYQQAQQRAELAEQRLQQMQMMVDMICHDIRNPLNGIVGHRELLQNYVAQLNAFLAGQLPDAIPQASSLIVAMNESLAAISTCTNHQQDLTNDLLTLSKLEAHAVELVLAPFNPILLIRSIIATCDASLQQKGLKKIVDLPTEDLMINGDSKRLTQILMNLLGNAIKFTHQGFIEISAQYSRDASFTTLTIKVKDSGIGLSQEQQKRLFDRFAQASPKTSGEYGGSGLGLFISKNLAQLMEGNIEVESEPGNGATFSVTVKCRNYTNQEIFTENHSAAPALIVELTPEQKKDIHILIAEDNDTNQKILKNFLESAGYSHCCFVKDGQAAVEQYQHERFDLVLMDIKMPIMTGPEAAAQIRAFEQQHARSPVPIICTSGYASAMQDTSILAAGMDDYIDKPYTRELVLSKISAALNKNRPSEPIVSAALTAPNKSSRTSLIKETAERAFFCPAGDNGKRNLDTQITLNSDVEIRAILCQVSDQDAKEEPRVKRSMQIQSQ